MINLKRIIFTMTTNETKSFQRFEGLIRNLKQNLELFDVSLTLANKECEKKKEKVNIPIAQALYSDIISHPELNHPNKPRDVNRTFTTARIRLNEQAIVTLYKYFSDYLVNIIGEVIKVNNCKALLGLISDAKNYSMTFGEIMRLSHMNSIIKEMANRVYRKLENERSTAKLLDKIIEVTKVAVDEDVKNKALLCLEIRHLIIHNNSKTDESFNEKNSILGDFVGVKKGDKIQLNFDLSKQAIRCVSELCRQIDNQLIETELVKGR